MAVLLRGALVEYGVDLIGPIPNVVIFQFNPETLTRSLAVPARPEGSASRETSQAGEPVGETISFTAHFTAADQLKDNKALARLFGVGPQLSALEKMVRPTSILSGAIGAVVDAIGDALGAAGVTEATQPIPRETYPRILFIWGVSRVLPVLISSMRITEQQYDAMLNPVQAEVEIELTVNAVDSFSDDLLAQGALNYTAIAKEMQAVANLANTAEQVVELIPL